MEMVSLGLLLSLTSDSRLVWDLSQNFVSALVSLANPTTVLVQVLVAVQLGMVLNDVVVQQLTGQKFLPVALVVGACSQGLLVHSLLE